MEKIILWEEELREQVKDLSQEQLESFLELAEFISRERIANCICRILQENERLWEWLFEKKDIELVDMKRELVKYIQKAQTIENEEYHELLSLVGTDAKSKVLIYSFDKISSYYISSLADYYEGIRAYLAQEKKDAFCKDLPECFPNIYFVENIDTSVNTLNRKFEEIAGEIVEHLTALDRYHENFEKLMGSQKSFIEIAQIFKKDTGIDCSPQAGREHIQQLRQVFCDAKTEQNVELICELHTKFRTFNIDMDKRDRLYFHPGRKDVADGKIIVKHIGKHL